jgi:cathepsin C
MIKLPIFILLVFLVSEVRGDLPVHCLKHQIAGEWKLSISETQLTGEGPLSCGHHIPDD